MLCHGCNCSPPLFLPTKVLGRRLPNPESLRAMTFGQRTSRMSNIARGRGFATHPLAGTLADGLLEALLPHVKPSGHHLFEILKVNLLKEEQSLQEKKKLLQDKVEQLKVNLLKEEQSLQEKKKLLQDKVEQLRSCLEKETKLRTLTYIELFKVQGLNDTRGLFEHIQERLAYKACALQLRGVPLWEAIIRSHSDLATCIHRCTKVPISNVEKQALHCYNMYTILSQHSHDGKRMAELKAGEGGLILFERGPLSSEQVRVFECLGDVANLQIKESTQTRNRFE